MLETGFYFNDSIYWINWNIYCWLLSLSLIVVFGVCLQFCDRVSHIWELNCSCLHHFQQVKQEKSQTPTTLTCTVAVSVGLQSVKSVSGACRWVCSLRRGETSHHLPEQHHGRIHRVDRIFWWTCHKVCPSPHIKLKKGWNRQLKPSTCLNRLDKEAKKLITELGSTSIDSLGFRDSWLFVGAKGATVKSVFEKVTQGWASRAPRSLTRKWRDNNPADLLHSSSLAQLHCFLFSSRWSVYAVTDQAYHHFW